MGHVVVEGVPVPAAIASSFSDPKKRPFSYTKPLPPSSSTFVTAVEQQRPLTPRITVSLPKVLPIVADSWTANQTSITTSSNTQQRPQSPQPPSPPPLPPPLPSQQSSIAYTEMPTNLQYNTPLPLYSREAAEEQYKQQLGAGPEIPLGTGDKHFDPEKSETLKAINAGEDDSFGKTFFEKIAQAEAPRIPVEQEPDWTEKARLKAERARSATPSTHSAHHTPTPYYNPNYATIHGTSTVSTNKKLPVRNRGYEFGGLDYVDKSRIPEGPSYDSFYYQPKPAREERRTTPGYEMGGLDFGKGNISLQGPYHGHGPEHPRLQPKFDTAHMKHNEMNIETAPNLNSVSPDKLVGDTISNQKIMKDEDRKQRDQFGTSFAPPGGFKEDHRTVARQQELPKPTTYSLSAKKENIGQRNFGYTPYQENRYRTQPRSHSAMSSERYESATYSPGEKEVTVETLLNDSALYPRKRTEIPEWHKYSLEKQKRWKNQSDPRLSRSQTYTSEPSWSRTVREKRNAWEAQTQNLESRLQLPASEKVPIHQPPHWYTKANRTHNVWQTAADRNALRAQSEFTDDSSRYRSQEYPGYGTSYTTEIRHAHDYRGGSTQQQYKQEEYKREQQSLSSQRDIPIGRSFHPLHTATPAPFDQGATSQSYSGQLQKWESRSTPQSYYTSSQYEKDENRSSYSSSKYQKEETSKEHHVSQPRAVRSYETQRTDTVAQSAPVSTKQIVTVTEGTGGTFNRAAEMAEVLPRGTIANTQASTQGNYTDADGRSVSYTRELMTSVDPHRECSLLKEEERRVVETPLEPGIISRHVTTKYYKKKTVTDTTTTTTTTTGLQ